MLSRLQGYIYVWGLFADTFDPGCIQPLPSAPDMKFQAYVAPAYCSTLNYIPARITGSNSANGKEPACLLTGDATNCELKLWDFDLQNVPVCMHSLQLVAKSSASGGGSRSMVMMGGSAEQHGPNDFFNHLAVQPQQGLVVLADELRRAVHVLHVSAGINGSVGSFCFDHAVEFSVAKPILSMALCPETFEDETSGLSACHLYTVQPEAIQDYTIVPEHCMPIAGSQPGPLAVTASISAPAAAPSPVSPPTAAAAVAPPMQQQQHQERAMREQTPEPPEVGEAAGAAASEGLNLPDDLDVPGESLER